jgi:hypothetical protein
MGPGAGRLARARAVFRHHVHFREARAVGSAANPRVPSEVSRALHVAPKGARRVSKDGASRRVAEHRPGGLSPTGRTIRECAASTKARAMETCGRRLSLDAGVERAVRVSGASRTEWDGPRPRRPRGVNARGGSTPARDQSRAPAVAAREPGESSSDQRPGVSARAFRRCAKCSAWRLSSPRVSPPACTSISITRC